MFGAVVLGVENGYDVHAVNLGSVFILITQYSILSIALSNMLLYGESNNYYGQVFIAYTSFYRMRKFHKMPKRRTSVDNL